MSSISIEELANQAEVSPDFVVRLIELGALEPQDGDVTTGAWEPGRVRLLHAWGEAGLPPEDIMELVGAGELSISWLDTPVIARGMRLEVTFDQLCSEEEVPLRMVQALYEAIGFAPPEPTEPIRAGDRELVDLVRAFLAAGAREGPTLRLLRVYADSTRRIAKAEAELYESEIEEPLRRSGRSERELLDEGMRFGGRVNAHLERTILDIYQPNGTPVTRRRCRGLRKCWSETEHPNAAAMSDSERSAQYRRTTAERWRGGSTAITRMTASLSSTSGIADAGSSFRWRSRNDRATLKWRWCEMHALTTARRRYGPKHLIDGATTAEQQPARRRHERGLVPLRDRLSGGTPDERRRQRARGRAPRSSAR